MWRAQFRVDLSTLWNVSLQSFVLLWLKNARILKVQVVDLVFGRRRRVRIEWYLLNVCSYVRLSDICTLEINIIRYYSACVCRRVCTCPYNSHVLHRVSMLETLCSSSRECCVELAAVCSDCRVFVSIRCCCYADKHVHTAAVVWMTLTLQDCLACKMLLACCFKCIATCSKCHIFQWPSCILLLFFVTSCKHMFCCFYIVFTIMVLK